jgi:predicted HAD superfamily Cof-like phosphohydrolase
MTFEQDIQKFNTMYRMPVAASPAIINTKRLTDFKSILGKELNEIDDIVDKLQFLEASNMPAEDSTALKLEVLTDLADLLGDLQVYCASEMAKWGLPLEETLAIIMQSNFSKMGADGKPIYDEQDKLQKGPNYWKPEPKLQMMLQGRLDAAALLDKASL